MVSWGKAFKGALEWLVYSLLWIITGGVLILIGFVSIFASSIAGLLPTAIDPILGLLQFSPVGIGAVGIGLIVLGIIVAGIGTRAANYKIISEMVAEEVKKLTHGSSAGLD